ncbi:MAG: hypothetical protein ACRCXX_14490 [Cetobacterium sp.]|uniref:hypothetical protein n=1 Tax=Cetobacterium sp. TaxID=2071632 RepID=UPI003F3C0537
MAKVKEPTLKDKISKREKMRELVKQEKKEAEKLGEPLMIGNAGDFTDFGREQYNMTSILGIDLNVCGLKDGTINIIWGDSQAGKTTNSVGIMEGIQLHNPDAVFAYFDTEQTVDDNFLNRFKDLNQENIFFFRYTKIETIMDKMLELLRENMVDYIFLDSYDATSSKTTQAKSFENDNQQMMAKAACMSMALPEVQELLKRNAATLTIIQQVRTKFNRAMQAYDDRTGGNALKFAPSTILKIANLKDGNELDDKGNVKTRYVRFQNQKCKVSRPYLETCSYINTDPKVPSAILKRKECLDYAFEYGILEKNGSWITMNYIDQSTGELKTEKFQGQDRALRILDSQLDLYSETKLKVYAAGLPTEVFIVKFDQLIELIEKENANMKKSKINAYKSVGREDLLTDMDKTTFKFDRKVYTPLTVLEMAAPEVPPKGLEEEYVSGADRFKLAQFNLLPFEEKEKIMAQEKKEIEKEMKLNAIKVKS